MRKLLSLQTSS